MEPDDQSHSSSLGEICWTTLALFLVQEPFLLGQRLDAQRLPCVLPLVSLGTSGARLDLVGGRYFLWKHQNYPVFVSQGAGRNLVRSVGISWALRHQVLTLADFCFFDLRYSQVCCCHCPTLLQSSALYMPAHQTDTPAHQTD